MSKHRSPLKPSLITSTSRTGRASFLYSTGIDKGKEKVLHGSCKECEQKDECAVGRSLSCTLEEVIVRERDRLTALLE